MQFTIIIATCGRPDRLLTVLCAVDAAVAAHGENDRIIVADNGVDHSAQPVVDVFSKQAKAEISYAQSKPRSKAAALNAGIALAKTEWLAFTDDDTLPEVNWLKAASTYAAREPVRVFGGHITAGPAAEGAPFWLKPGRSGRVPRGSVFVEYAPRSDSGLLGKQHLVPFGANIFVRRDVFEELGGYDEELWDLCGKAALGSEDGEFGVRLKQLSEPIGYCHESLVVHPVHHERLTLCSHLRLAFYYGWRDPLVFFDPSRPALELFRLRLIAGLMFRGGVDLLRRDWAGAVTSSEGIARHLGCMASRLSHVYRHEAVPNRLGKMS